MKTKRSCESFLVWPIGLALAIAVLAGCGAREQELAPTEETSAANQRERQRLANQSVGLIGQFDYDGAAKVLERLLADATAGQINDSKVNLAIALLNRREGEDLNRSAALLDEVIAADSSNLRAPYCRALLEFNSGATYEAQRLFEKVAKNDPSDSYALYYVGQCLFATGDHAEALASFQRAIEVDPYLRSAYYGAFQAAQRLGDKQLARESLKSFQRLAENPRARLAELKYTRMGPKAAVVVSAVGRPQGDDKPEGKVFLSAVPIAITNADAVVWATPGNGAGPSITVADINGDGRSDLFLAAAVVGDSGTKLNAVLIGEESGYRADTDSPLASVASTNAALWGDYDDDGLLDVYLCRDGSNQLWRQSEPGVWLDVTESTQTDAGDHNTVDGAIYDVDHDGDLDLLLVNADAAPQLLNNNRDGTFRSIAEELGITGDGRPVKRLLLTDVDSDDDTDLLLIHEDAPHELFLNDRLWRYRASGADRDLLDASLLSAVSFDSDTNGFEEVFSLGDEAISRWSQTDTGNWEQEELVEASNSTDGSIAVIDCDGDTRPEVLSVDKQGLRVIAASGDLLEEHDAQGLYGSAAVLVSAAGPEVVAFRGGKGPIIWRAGPGRHAFARLRLSGKTDKALEMRSNASGVGVIGAARIGSEWASIPAWRSDSGPGQSHQPKCIGSGGVEKIDFIRLLWPDAVSQTELDLAVGELHDIPETQRQAGSCPLLFVWDGQGYRFIADLIGAGGIGFNLGKAEYYEPRPFENFLIPDGVLVDRGGRYEIKLGEPMEEICYFDAIRLVAYDLPPGWSMVLDERFGASEPLPTGTPRYYKQEILPIAAKNDREENITAAVTLRDGVAAPLERNDHRFIGMTDPHHVVLEFDQPLDEMKSPWLVFDGWVEYAYSQTAFASWQAGETYTEPSIDAMGSDGKWKSVFSRFGYMAGTARRSSAPLPVNELPAGTTKLRISTNMQIYWDRFSVIEAQDCESAMRREVRMTHADVRDVGFSERVMRNQRNATYDYNRRPPFADARHPRGYYSRIGHVEELLEEADNALAIIGPGEEVHIEYEAINDQPPAGWTRRWVLESDGWCKDADLFTLDSGTVEPLPARSAELNDQQEARRTELHNKYNTRFRVGW